MPLISPNPPPAPKTHTHLKCFWGYCSLGFSLSLDTLEPLKYTETSSLSPILSVYGGGMMWALVYVLLWQRLTSFPDVSESVWMCVCVQGEKMMQGSMCAVLRSLPCPTTPPELSLCLWSMIGEAHSLEVETPVPQEGRVSPCHCTLYSQRSDTTRERERQNVEYFALCLNPVLFQHTWIKCVSWKEQNRCEQA